MRIRCATAMLTVLVSAPLALVLLLPAAGRAQTGSKVVFNVSPTAFRAGQASTSVLSVFCVSTVPLTISPGDTFTFFFDASVGSLTSIAAPPSVTSAGLSAGDFAGTLSGTNQVIITYTGQAKPFSYGDTLSLEVAFNASAKIATGKVSFSSRFTGSVNGNLPYTTVSIVDFANGGVTTVAHDQTLMGDGTAASPLGVSPGGIDTTQLANGGVTAAK